MSGPRVTSGTKSKQDYGTPSEFLAPVQKRFGKITFDLAAHAGNCVHPRYFAPKVFVENVERGKTNIHDLVASMITRGARPDEAEREAWVQYGAIVGKGTVRVQNRDPYAFAFDALKQDWATVLNGGLGWDNCEFSNIAPWAEKHAAEAKRGASTLLLTPASVGSNWARDHVLGTADVYVLSGVNSRLCFDGTNPFPKDCMVSHYHRDALGLFALWDWRRDELTQVWWPHKRALSATVESMSRGKK